MLELESLQVKLEYNFHNFTHSPSYISCTSIFCFLGILINPADNISDITKVVDTFFSISLIGQKHTCFQFCFYTINGSNIQSRLWSLPADWRVSFWYFNNCYKVQRGTCLEPFTRLHSTEISYFLESRVVSAELRAGRYFFV